MMIPDSVKKYVYYEQPGIVLLRGDCLKILPLLSPVDALITDPIWPNSIFEGIDQWHLLHMMNALAPERKRSAYILGCDSDPRIIKETLPFFRTTWLRYARPHYKGRLLYGADVAYYFGEPPKSEKGAHLIGGEWCRTDTRGKESKHPCPRPLEQLRYVLSKWSRSGETILDPFIGSGTTAVAAKDLGRKCIGIEIEAEYLDMAIDRLKQEILV